ncbi:transposase [Verrucomicrobiales bacterium]|jgi:transposase-like protein|nr:transposase [Verrucomicrobiales bacterium]
MSGKRYQEAEKRKWVRRFNDDNSSAAAFCRKFNLPYGSFMAWKRLYRGSSSKPKTLAPQQSKFIELTVEPRRSSARNVATPTPVAELSLGSGLVLRVFAPSDSRE